MARVLFFFFFFVALLVLGARTTTAADYSCLSSDRACLSCASGSAAAGRGSLCGRCVPSADLIDGTCLCPPGHGQTGKPYSSGEARVTHPTVQRLKVRPMSSGSSSDPKARRRRNDRRMLLLLQPPAPAAPAAPPSPPADPPAPAADGRLACSPCDAGAYSRSASRVRSARCKRCPEGTSSKRGSASCYVAEGFYFDPARPRGAQVVACREGEACPGGDIFSAGEGQAHGKAQEGEAAADNTTTSNDNTTTTTLPATTAQACSPNPCLNGGLCTRTSATAYACACPPGFSGPTCAVAAVVADPCSPPSPCLNGGVCKSVGGSSYTCACAAGFSGATCGVEVDPCAPNPCLNQGACSKAGAGAFKCACAAGFSGANCTVVVDPCSPNPCLNDGICTKTGAATFSCACAPGFSGATCASARARVLRTVAGTGVAGGPEFRGVAADALLNGPHGLAVHDGAVYLVDTYNDRVLRITIEDGVVHSIAGTGVAGFGDGDGKLAQNAPLSAPKSLSFDPAGNLFICDSGNNRVRKIDTNGIITTVAGLGALGSKDGPGEGNGGKALAAALAHPTDLALDKQGNIYIAEASRIRKVSSTDGTIDLFAGTGHLGFSGDGGPARLANISLPRGLAVDAQGALLFSDGNRIRRVSAEGIISTIAGTGAAGFLDGPAQTAKLWNPHGLAVTGDGSVVFADASNFALRKLDAKTGNITTLAGGPSKRDVFQSPLTVAVDEHMNVYVADHDSSTVRFVTPDGNVSVFAGVPGKSGSSDSGSLAAFSRLSAPRGVAVDASGGVFFGDSGNGRVRKIKGQFIATLGGGSAGQVSDVAVDGAGNVYYVSDGLNVVRRVSPDGSTETTAGDDVVPGYRGDGGPAVDARLNHPTGIAATAAGVLFVCDRDNHRVRKIENAVITTVAGTGQEGTPTPGSAATSSPLKHPTSVAVAPATGDALISQSSCVLRVSAQNGTLSVVAGNCTEPGDSGDNGPAAQARFSAIVDLDVDSAGRVYVVDAEARAVRVIGADGVVRRLVAGDAFEAPSGVAVDRSGNVYVTDAESHLVRKIE